MIEQTHHPAEQLVAIMNRIYQGGMTTLSGGNLSIQDDDGNIWITPAGIDKGTLTPQDMSCVHPDGRHSGPHRPSSEFPFHQAIYRSRPDILAIAHAHPPATVAFSICRVVPDIELIPTIRQICGPIGYAPYALTGSEGLGRVIAATFAGGYDTIMLENHGAVAAGKSLFEAFRRLEALDFGARILIGARTLGGVIEPPKFDRVSTANEEMKHGRETPTIMSEHEDTLRLQTTQIARRAYDRQLMLSGNGDLSVRIEAEDFLITPHDRDRRHLLPRDLVRIENGRPQPDKHPNVSNKLHQAIYHQHPEIGAVILANPPYATAFALARTEFDTRTIPESYFMLRDIPKLPYRVQFQDVGMVAGTITSKSPVVLIQNEGILVTGKELLHALDRLEVAEYSARSLINTKAIGPLQPIGPAELQELRTALGLT